MGINPFSPKAIDAMRNGGYAFRDALCELIDNSIDADANEAEVWLETDKFPYPVGTVSDVLSFYVEDNGDGMDNPTESIGFSKRKGNKKYGDADLGAFGVGLPSSTMSQGTI